MSARRHVGSTYRLQLNGLGFAGATALVPFLHDLGIETCYASPITQARANSTHGYDVVDPTVLDPALGTRADLDDLLAALAGHGMGLLVDIVPNHMAASVENRYFADVLCHGRESQYAAYFDIAWDEHGGKILLPVLGQPLVDVLAAGEIRVITDESSAEPVVAYFDQRYPVAPGSADARESVAAVLSRQHYLLADWRVANAEVNYRRFFDINELIGVRQEDPRVFAETHRLVAELSTDPRVVGFRVDHVDGLYDPAAYLESLRGLIGGTDPEPVILVEKILARSEQLPRWPVEGTTGYEFGNEIVGLFTDAQGAASMARDCASATGDARSFAERSVDAKRRAVETLFAHQVAQVAASFVAALDGSLSTADAATAGSAIEALTASLDVYRTYRQAGVAASAADLQRIRAAADRARPGLSTAEATALDQVVEVLSGDLDVGGAAARAVGSWQQLSGPVAAKGVEDTALYDSGQLLAAADVGAEPDHPAVAVDEVHDAMTRRQRDWPLAMSATSTHDSKRSHDVRCRLAALSEVAADWEATIAALEHELVRDEGAAYPDVTDRRYVYETLVGAWPIDGQVGEDFARRVGEHLVKAAREARRNSNWIDPAVGYEEVLTGFARRLVLGEPAGRTLIERTVATVERAGVVNSLGSVLLKATAPGEPDVYQGDDAWFQALVDPDNRRSLDVAAHARLLASLPRYGTEYVAEAASLLAGWRTGAVKQLVLRNALQIRRDRPDLFASGRYQPLEIIGTHRRHVVAFARVHEQSWAISVVPRLTVGIAGPDRFPVGADIWSDTEIVVPSGCPARLVDGLTGQSIVSRDGRIAVSAALATLPVALLV